MPSEVQSASAYALPPNAEWVDVPSEMARRHPLYGVAGWLVFFVFLFEFFIIINVGNLVLPNQIYPLPNQYLILADTGFMLAIVAMILTKSDITGPGVWAWVSFHFLGLIFAYSEFGADGTVSEQEKVIIAGYAIAFLLRDIPTAWYFTSSRRVNITMSRRMRPNDIFLRDIEQPRSNGLDRAEETVQRDPVQSSPDAIPVLVQTPMKECPTCAEIVKSQARACRFCGHKFANGSSPATPPERDLHLAIDTSKATKSTETIDPPTVLNSVDLVEYRGFFIAEMENGKFQIVSENGDKLKKSGEYDSSEYAKATLDYFITIAVELMSYPASLPRTD